MQEQEQERFTDMSPEEVAAAFAEGKKLAEQQAAAENLPPNPRATADIMARIESRLPQGNAVMSGIALIRRRTVTFQFDGAFGAPEIFIDENGNYLDVELGVQSLNSIEEVEALKNVTSAEGAPFALAKAAFAFIEGKPIKQDMKDFYWEAIGQTGRQLCILATQSLGLSSQGAMGKYQQTFTVR